MITKDFKSQTDRLWDVFRSRGSAAPLEVVDQITSLLFIKRPVNLHTAQDKRARRQALIPLRAMLIVQKVNV